MLKENTIIKGRYLLVKKIGSGGFSEVWLALDKSLNDEDVVLKIYAPAVGLSDTGLKMFQREYKVNSSLPSHPNILRTLYFDILDHRPFLILPYCKKGSLLDELEDEVYKGGRGFTEEKISKIITEVASALTLMHEYGVIHQDIKPDNFLIDDNDNCKITDFGISASLRNTLTKATGGTSSALSIAYAPPERFNARPQVLAAGDIFSLGVMIYELACGETPWMGQGGITLKKGADLPELPENYSTRLNNLMQACLSVDPKQRPTAKEVDNFLRNADDPAIKKANSSKSTSFILDNVTKNQTKRKLPIEELSKSTNWAPRLASRKSVLFYLGLFIITILSSLMGWYILWRTNPEDLQGALTEDILAKKGSIQLLYDSLRTSADLLANNNMWEESLTNYQMADSVSSLVNAPLLDVSGLSDSIKSMKQRIANENFEATRIVNLKEENTIAEQYPIPRQKEEDMITEQNRVEKQRADDERAYRAQKPIKHERFDGIFKDNRDGQIYEWIKIGNQVWMTQNIRYLIPGKSYNDSNNNTFYRYEASKKACPDGWHLPTLDDWNILESFLGGALMAQEKMKGKTNWLNNNNGTNESGFNAQPIGFVDEEMKISNVNLAASYWIDYKSQEYPGRIYTLWIDYIPTKGLEMNYWPGDYAFACRCIKD